MFTLFPALRLHVWGGLGSQLFAIPIVLKIMERFPNRKIILVLHSSGVTRRNPEIVSLFPELQYEILDDFKSRTSHDSNIDSGFFRKRITEILKSFLFLTGLIAEENDSQNRKVRWWTLQVRGHYFHRRVDEKFINLLGQRLKDNCTLEISNYENCAAIHYRLGDLLELTNKTPITNTRIAKVLNEDIDFNRIILFSDSLEKALSLLSDVLIENNIQPKNTSTFDTIWISANTQKFIGTSSKLSYWIIMLRLHFTHKTQNFLPSEDSKILNLLTNNKNIVSFYA